MNHCLYKFPYFLLIVVTLFTVNFSQDPFGLSSLCYLQVQFERVAGNINKIILRVYYFTVNLKFNLPGLQWNLDWVIPEKIHTPPTDGVVF